MRITERTRRIMDLDEKNMSYTTRIPYYPLVVERAYGCNIEDIEGNQFIDFLSSAAVTNTGHNHPKIINAVKKQLDKFMHYTPAYVYHSPHAQLGEKLCEIIPLNYQKRIAFGLSGSSSVDGALKLVRSYTKRNIILSFLRSYHGTTIGAISVSGISLKMRNKLGPLLPEVRFIPYPDCYRCIFGEKYPSCHLRCFSYLEELVQTILPPKEIAAIILEPIQGDAGVIIPPLEYYKKLQSLCRKYCILIIADEVQTGFGRTGKWFAFEHFSLEPDVLVMGKAIASGMPLSAIAAKKEIMESWEAPAHFFNTAGNPVSCVAALETLNVIQEEKLIENCLLQGELLVNGFQEMKKIFKCIGDVRGRGLLIGVDIVKNEESKERDYKKTAKICWRCWEKGLILAFFSGSVLRVAPPLIIGEKEANTALQIIKGAIEDVENGKVADEVFDIMQGW